MMGLRRLLILFCFLGTCAYAQPTISFTFDDGDTQDMPGYPLKTWNEMILSHLEKGGVKAVFFVTGNNKRGDKGKYLLSSWNDKGHFIANHTYSHPSYSNPKVTFEQFRVEILKTDSIIRLYSKFLPLFRFPYLKEGDTKAKIDSLRTFLKEKGYKNGHVTIDGSDWYIDSRLRMRLRDNPRADISRFEQYYLDHLFERAMFYEQLSYKLTGRHIKHTLLLHHNLTSALFAGKAIQMFRDKGWKVEDANEAFKDEIFNTQPNNVPAGESLIWAMAKESGQFENVLRYPAEDSKYEKEAMDKLGL
jgi:peptidoglycan-N-acetylglucosamine deacetylase